MLRKIIAGGSHRKRRVHDHHGNVISQSRFFRHVGSALTSSVRRVAFGGFPNGPWIFYDGQRIIDEHLTKQSSVLEFGSGASASWCADRAKSKLAFKPLQQGDPTQREPDNTKAGELLGWELKVQLREGLIETIDYFRKFFT